MKQFFYLKVPKREISAHFFYAVKAYQGGQLIDLAHTEHAVNFASAYAHAKNALMLGPL
jgi:hypothetical protein